MFLSSAEVKCRGTLSEFGDPVTSALPQVERLMAVEQSRDSDLAFPDRMPHPILPTPCHAKPQVNRLVTDGHRHGRSFHGG